MGAFYFIFSLCFYNPAATATPSSLQQNNTATEDQFPFNCYKILHCKKHKNKTQKIVLQNLGSVGWQRKTKIALGHPPKTQFSTIPLLAPLPFL
jgi:hypothetical protein